MGQCDGVQSYLKKLEEKNALQCRTFIPIGCFEHGAQLLISDLQALAPWLKDRPRLASFGDFLAFFCGRGPKTHMPSQRIRA